MSNFEVSTAFFLQLVVILVSCRVAGRIVQSFGQPQVVGEMIAGALLGPSLLGWLAPDVQAALFPKPVMVVLYSVAQLGLVFYMFLVGLEFDVDLMRQRMRSAVAVSWAGILVPFAVGGALGYALHADPRLFGANVGTLEAMLFVGAAMSITAFPVLARIIYDSGLSGTPVGTMALAAGSADDAAAWCALAVVLASFSGNASVAALAIGGGALLTALLLVVVRPRLAALSEALLQAGAWDRWGFPGTLLLLLPVAWFADRVGIHAVFGAFVLGAVMPRGEVRRRLEGQLAPLTTHVLVPLFFTYSGLNTRFDLVDTPALWLLTLVVLAGACLGKGVACYVAARFTGASHRDAAAVGALMNARGMMELILLNIGLERGLITPTLFSILAFMAIATTLAATPIFARVYARPPLARAA